MNTIFSYAWAHFRRGYGMGTAFLLGIFNALNIMTIGLKVEGYAHENYGDKAGNVNQEQNRERERRYEDFQADSHDIQRVEYPQ